MFMILRAAKLVYIIQYQICTWECTTASLRELKIRFFFSGGAYPQTPLDNVCLYTHTISRWRPALLYKTIHLLRIGKMWHVNWLRHETLPWNWRRRVPPLPIDTKVTRLINTWYYCQVSPPSVCTHVGRIPLYNRARTSHNKKRSSLKEEESRFMKTLINREWLYTRTFIRWP